MYNVLIVEDELLVCQGLNLLVDWEGLGFVVAGFCRDGLSAKRQLEMEKFDLVIWRYAHSGDERAGAGALDAAARHENAGNRY